MLRCLWEGRITNAWLAKMQITLTLTSLDLNFTQRRLLSWGCALLISGSKGQGHNALVTKILVHNCFPFTYTQSSNFAHRFPVSQCVRYGVKKNLSELFWGRTLRLPFHRLRIWQQSKEIIISRAPLYTLIPYYTHFPFYAFQFFLKKVCTPPSIFVAELRHCCCISGAGRGVPRRFWHVKRCNSWSFLICIV